MKNAGWRKPTSELLQAQRFAEVGEQLTIPKTRAIVATKKVAAAIGLKSQDLLLLDTFGAVTQPQDWEQGRRPIVWASNQFLMEQTGFSLTTLRRHVRRLCEVGVISMKDSPNGKRWGRRDADGVIVEAYGFDLAPMAARAVEFEALYEHLQSERALCASLRNAITVTRRMIRAKIEDSLEAGLSGPWAALKDVFSTLIQTIPGRSERSGVLKCYLDRLKALLRSVERSFEVAHVRIAKSDILIDPKKNDAQENTANVEPTGNKNGTHILTTNKPKSVTCNGLEKEQAADHASIDHDAIRTDDPEKISASVEWNTSSNIRRSNMKVRTLMASCPHFAEMAGDNQGHLRDWNDVHRAAAALRPIIGISADAWDIANKALGPVVAAASIALILDKSAEGEIKSPGGYLRGLVERSEIGQLRLERSLFGRLSKLQS